MFARSAQEEAKLNVMQRVWQLRRGGSSSSSIFDETEISEDILAPARQNRTSIQKGPCVASPAPPSYTCSDVDSDNEIWETCEPIITKLTKQAASLILNAGNLGDIPAQYKICSVEAHQFPVAGVYIDKRIVPGFKYRVRPLPGAGELSNKNKCLFDNRALTLRSIGRGYARRFTFDADKNKLNDNENYFWSDNRPEGYAFELEVVSEGDKFTIFDTNREAQGTLEVLNVEGPQVEISNANSKDGIEKRSKVKFTGKVEFFETGVAKPTPLSGVAVAVKSKSKATAEITKVINVVIKKQRYYLVPGINKIHYRTTVRGADINDVPTKYTMTGLASYEIPVVGTYVDPRVIPGFHYKIRPNHRKDHLFGGRALKLVSIGMGYAKRLTFQPDSLMEPDNYLWSDNHPDGLGLEPRAVHKGMEFFVKAGEQILGEAKVFRADKPQREERMEKVQLPNGQFAIEKYIDIDVLCHFKLARTGGASTENDEHFMRIHGRAVLRKEPRSIEAQVLRVENVGIDSQLNVLFAQNHTVLSLLPKNGPN